MTESSNPPLSSLTGDLRAESERFLKLATTRGERSDVLATAVVGCGYALLALVDQHKPTQHGPDTCPWDFHELADLTRIWEGDPSTAAEDTREWLHEQELDPDALGNGAEDESDAAYERWRDQQDDRERAAFEEHGPP